MNSQDFGKFIHKLRKEKGITQLELAEKLNVSDKAISRWENGKNYPDIEILEDLSKELDVSISELIACKKFENTVQAEIETAKTVITKTATVSRLKKLTFSIAALLVIIIILLIAPFQIISHGNGETSEYQALTYKFVKWNKTLSDNEIYRKNSFYFFDDSKKTLDNLWLHEEIGTIHHSTYIDDIKSRAINIGAEMPRIVYMDYQIVIFSGACGIVTYNYANKIIVNRLSAEYLRNLGYNLFWASVDNDKRIIYITEDPINNSEVLPLAYSMNDRTVKRVDYVPGTLSSDCRINDIDEATRIKYEIKDKYLVSWNCFDNHDFKAFLIADNDWNMESLQLVIEQNGKTQMYKIFN